MLVQNHRTAVVGGLISSDAENARQGVPFLSDIPVLGNLFSDNSREMTKQNLLVFLTPHIVRTREDLQALALDERQKFVRALGRTEVNNMPTVAVRADVSADLQPRDFTAAGFAAVPGADRSSQWRLCSVGQRRRAFVHGADVVATIDWRGVALVGGSLPSVGSTGP